MIHQTRSVVSIKSEISLAWPCISQSCTAVSGESRVSWIRSKEQPQMIAGQCGTRMQSQTNLVKRMGSIATRAVPDNSGVHLRFINRSDGADNIDANELDRKMAFTPQGGTKIGTSLRDKVLKPFIYNVLDGGDNLKRPYLVLTITDGEPWEEKKDEFRNAVVECRQKVVQKGYRPQGRPPD